MIPIGGPAQKHEVNRSDDSLDQLYGIHRVRTFDASRFRRNQDRLQRSHRVGAGWRTSDATEE
jgi:hypothetical protein